jgi:hypothetical protein
VDGAHLGVVPPGEKGPRAVVSGASDHPAGQGGSHGARGNSGPAEKPSRRP